MSNAAVRRSSLVLVAFALASVLSTVLPGSGGTARASGSGPTPGIAIQRLGTGLTAFTSSASGYERYPMAIVDRNYASSAASLPSTTRVLVYHAGVDINMYWNTGVSYQEAVANNWILRDVAGNYIHNAGYRDNVIGDIGNTAYQQRWASNVASYLASVGADGVYIDEVLGDAALLTNNIWPVKYPNHQTWYDAMASFVDYVGPYLKARGYYVAVNAKNFIGGDIRANDGSLDVMWWQRLAPSVNGLVSEYWQQNPINVAESFSDCGCDWTGWWSKWQRLITTAQAGGADFYSLVYGSGSDTRTIRYERASFLMDWNGRGGGMIWNPLDTGDPWNGDWTGNIGTPSGARYAVGVGWRREYSGGTVLLNSSRSASQTFALGGSYLLPNGSPTSTVTLAPMTAMELHLSTIAPPAASPSVNSTQPALSGTAEVGRTLQVSTGSWSPTPSSYAYAWHRCSSAGTNCQLSPTSTSTSSYLLTSADAGSTIVAQVAADGVWTTSANSLPSGVVVTAAATPEPSPLPRAPVSTTSPQVSGPTLVGKTLTASAGTWTPDPSSVTFQWQRCSSSGCASIAGATGWTMTLAKTDHGASIRVIVVAANSVGSTTAASEAVGPVRSSAKKR